MQSIDELIKKTLSEMPSWGDGNGSNAPVSAPGSTPRWPNIMLVPWKHFKINENSFC